MNRKAIIIGASSGIGWEIALQLAQTGADVAAIARRKDRLDELALTSDRIRTYVHDVTDTHEVSDLFDRIALDLGGIDLVVYCSGAMPEVGPSEFDFAKDKTMIDVNITGAVAWLDEAANRFSQTKHGSIVGIGSVAGDRGRCGQPVYNMTKAALTTYLEALRNRLAKLGINVVTIKPGPTQTEMTAHLKSRGMAQPAAVAAFVIKRMDKTGEHYVKFTHRIAFAIIRRIPSPLFRRLSI